MEAQKQELICKLTAPALRTQRKTVIQELKDLLVDKREIATGYKYSFPGDDATLDKVVDFIKTERLCCEFFTFNLSIEGGTVALDITGPEGSKQFLDHEVGF